MALASACSYWATLALCMFSRSRSIVRRAVNPCTDVPNVFDPAPISLKRASACFICWFMLLILREKLSADRLNRTVSSRSSSATLPPPLHEKAASLKDAACCVSIFDPHAPADSCLLSILRSRFFLFCLFHPRSFALISYHVPSASPPKPSAPLHRSIR